MIGQIEFLRLASVIVIVFTHTRHNIEAGIFYFIFEVLPPYGTSTLSIISGYLFWEHSKNKPDLLTKKIHTLLVPYLLSNSIIVAFAIIFSHFEIYFLNRIDYDYSIITQGIFSLDSAPINPPTFFIRDLFILFCFISLFRKNYYSLLIIVPYLILGKLFLRYEIVAFFLTGIMFNNNKETLFAMNMKFLYPLLSLFSLFCFYQNLEIIGKYIFSLLIFLIFFEV